jgi:Methyl-accepting chemotaxis protein
MNLKLKTKLTFAFGVILIFFLMNIITSMNFIKNSSKSIIHVKDFTYKQLEYSEQINVSVIQVQQFLSDSSATKNKDGFEEAEKYKVLFKDSIIKLKSINPDMKDKIEKIDKDFDNFYELGIKMTNVYINEGTENGNVLMSQFDPMAIKLSNEIDELNKKSKESMNQDLQNIQNVMSKSVKVAITLGMFSLIIAIIVIAILSSSITNPINNMFNILHDLESGEGDLTKRITIKSRDEIGKMAESFNNFMDNLVNMVKNIKENSVIVSRSSEVLNDGGIQIAAEIMKINNGMDEVSSGSENISDSVNQVTDSGSDISKSSQITADNVQEICIITEEINNTAIESGKLALDTKLEMEKIESSSSNTMLLNEKLGEKAKEIEKIIDTIKFIADQTNLLALNASIEAARAGEHGRGFVVVADEIRGLSENNSESSKMIENLIGSIREMIKDTISSTLEEGANIKQGSVMVENVFVELQKIIEGIKRINDRIQSIAVNSQVQSDSIQELTATMEVISSSNCNIASDIKKISNGVHLQTDVISEFSKMVTNLNSSANELSNLVNRFKTE